LLLIARIHLFLLLIVAFLTFTSHLPSRATVTLATRRPSAFNRPLNARSGAIVCAILGAHGEVAGNYNYPPFICHRTHREISACGF
jgi:hypothetical protein